MKTQKIIFLLFFVFSFSFTKLYSQNYLRKNTYLDALKLKEIYKSEDVDAFNNLLKEYGIQNESEWQQNPFFQNLPFLKPKVGAYLGEIPKSEAPESSPSKNFSPTSSSPINFQASAINGLASFMAGRFKQEVFQVSVNQFFKQVSKQKSDLIQGIFPKTYNYILDFKNNQNTYYGLDLTLLKESAQLDLENFPDNIALNSEKVFPKLVEKPYGIDLLKSSYYCYEFTKNGVSLDHLFLTLSQKKYENPKFKNIIEIGDIISTALINKKGTDNVWIDISTLLPSKINDVTTPEIRMFYGLLYEQLKTKINSLDAFNESITSEQLYSLFQYITKLNTLEKYVSSKNFQIKTNEESIYYVREIGDVYSTFINQFTKKNNFESFDFDENQLQIPDKYFTLVSTFQNEKYNKLIPILLLEFKDNLNENSATMRSLYLISQFASIENSTDMENALQTYALPIGSSSIKRNSNFNISLNGYVGFTGGFETVLGSQKKLTNGNIGLAAPIGISTTFSKGRLTCFVSIIDIGSIVNQRLGNDGTQYNNLKFEQFLSPGVGLYYNIKSFPISAGFQFSHILNLRNIQYNDGTATVTETNRSVQRINFNILIDLPFFNIYNR